MSAPDTEHRAKIAEARNVLGEVIARARFANEPTVLVNRGKDAAVIVGPDFYEEALRNIETLRRLRERAQAPDDAKPNEKTRARTIAEALDSVAHEMS